MTGGEFRSCRIAIFTWGERGEATAAGGEGYALVGWQPDFVRVQYSTFCGGCASLFKVSLQDIFEDCGLQACGVTVDKEKQGFVRKQATAGGDESVKVFLYFPDFAVCTASETWRVHDYGVVGFAAADFAVGKLGAIFYYVANAIVWNVVEGGVAFADLGHAFGRVNVGDVRARHGRSDSCAAGIAEKV